MATATVSVKTIIQMLASTHKNITIVEHDIANWCGECIEEIGEFTAMTRFRDVRLTIRNNRAELPCNVFRVLHVKQGANTPVYSINHPHITFTRYSGVVTIDYLGIPVDADNYPIIDAKARQACYWYCLIKLLTEEYGTGKITHHVWDHYQTQQEYYIAKARGNMGNMTRDDLNRITKVMMNMVQNPFMPNDLD